MMALKKHVELEVLFFVLVGALAGYVILHQMNEHNKTLVQALQTQPENAAVATIPTTTPIPTPTIAPTAMPALNKITTPPATFTPTGSTTSQISSDGTKKVILNTVTNKDGTQTYDVSTADNTHAIYSKTLDSSSSVTIPYNAWSPDNTYFFIQENDGSQIKVMVFNGNGQTFANGQAFLDLTGVFAQYAPNAIFGAATGWASDNLIVIQTKLSDGNEGTSYWFGVPGESVTPLSTQF